MARPVLLVGSVGLEDAETVFRGLAANLGDQAKRYPDGETGKRHYWIRWQREKISQHPDFEPVIADREFANFKDAQKRDLYRVREGVDPTAVRFDKLEYAEQAIASYAIFAGLKLGGVIPDSVRFQVSLPTPVALVSGFVVLEQRGLVEPAYIEALQRDIQMLTAAIPHDELAIQWDVCYEVVGHDGGFDLHYDNILNGSVQRLTPLINAVPVEVEVGVHLCYGDPGHKHIVEPQDVGTSVAFSNAICEAAGRPVNWVHMPVPKQWDQSDNFTALNGLRVPAATEVYLGLVHYTDGEAGTRARMALASQHLSEFGIATECGFGRRAPETIPSLLALHAAVAA